VKASAVGPPIEATSWSASGRRRGESLAEAGRTARATTANVEETLIAYLVDSSLRSREVPRGKATEATGVRL